MNQLTTTLMEKLTTKSQILLDGAGVENVEAVLCGCTSWELCKYDE